MQRPAERRGRCDQADAANWTALLASLSISVEDPLSTPVFSDVLPLARAQKFSVYDAAYFELAVRRGLPLATLDKSLKAAAASVGVALFDPLA